MDFGNAAMMASIIMGLASVPFIASETGAFSPTASVLQNIPGISDSQESGTLGEMTESYGPDGYTKEIKLPFGKFSYTIWAEGITQELIRPDRKTIVTQNAEETVWATQSREGSCEVRQTAEQVIETCKTPDGTIIKKTISGTTTTESKGNVMTTEEQCETLREYLQEDVSLMEEMKLGSQETLFINEFMTNPDADIGETDWIEIYNPSSEEVSIEGMVLKGSTSTTETLSGTISGEGFRQINLTELSLSSSATGGVIYLKNGDMVVDMILYGGFSDGEIPNPGKSKSTGRVTDGGDTWTMFETPTPEATNEPEEEA